MPDFPISAAALLTVSGAAIFTALVLQWFKAYLSDWRFTNLAALGLAEVVAIIAQCILSKWQPTGEALFAAILIGFFGAGVATWGAETIKNLLGKMGIGSRSDTALLNTAIQTITRAGITMKVKENGIGEQAVCTTQPYKMPPK